MRHAFEPPEAPRRAAAATGKPSATAGKTILFIDDMLMFREPIALALRSRGYTVKVASNGADALTFVAENRAPDVVLLDLGLPGKDGLAVLEELRGAKRTSKVPVIILTASANRDFVLRAKELGVQDYLLKAHCTVETLLERVGRQVAEREAA